MQDPILDDLLAIVEDRPFPECVSDISLHTDVLGLEPICIGSILINMCPESLRSCLVRLGFVETPGALYCKENDINAVERLCHPLLIRCARYVNPF